MTQPAKSQEPSMEEILASIRRIIADDDASKSAPRPAEPPQAAAPAPAARPAPPPAAAAAPPRVTPPEPSLDEAVAPSRPDSEPMADVEDQASDILDLTEQMAAPMPQPRAGAKSPRRNSAPSMAVSTSATKRKNRRRKCLLINAGGARSSRARTIRIAVTRAATSCCQA